MAKVQLTVPTNVAHVSQIITGFLTLREQGWDVEIVDRSRDAANPFYGLPIVIANVHERGILIYDVWDGYQAPDAMERCLNACDFYFKRSFSAEENALLFPGQKEKMYPLGFNYHVTHRDNPIAEPGWKAFLKPLLGRTPDHYFTPEVFEGKAARKEGRPVKILFLTRLWDDREPGFSEEELAERTYINNMRIEIIRTLRERYGVDFVGGLNDSDLSRKWAPDLIMPAQYTERRKYLKLLHESDICIGSMGLFESIGWKTGEYVAAAKAIVNEHFHYSVPGGFREGEHYLGFGTAGECLEAVRLLVEDPEKRYDMQCKNEQYYQAYLKPDKLVKNAIDLMDRKLAEEKAKNT